MLLYSGKGSRGLTGDPLRQHDVNRPDVSKSRDFIIFCDKVFYFRP